MSKEIYKITTETGKVFYAEVPENKRLRGIPNSQLGIWYENLEGGKYRGRGIEVVKTKEAPAKGAMWLSFNSDSLENKPEKKKKKELSIQ